jgi:AcrR family transcriptional regulator
MRVLEAAGACFGERGYPGTTLRDIARAAGVSLDTVQAQGTKAQLFLAAFDLALVGEDQALPLREQSAPELREAFAADTLEGYMTPGCAFLADGNRRSAALWRAFVGAAAGEEELAEAYAAKMQAMRAESVSGTRLLISRGVISAPADIQALADELWLTAHVAQYHLLVIQAGWSEERYLAWLTESMIAAVRRHCG